jgi:hypothetical protein
MIRSLFAAHKNFRERQAASEENYSPPWGLYDIRHPDLIMVGRRAAVIGITNEPGGAAFDRTIKVDLLHGGGIKELPGVPPSQNGPSTTS